MGESNSSTDNNKAIVTHDKVEQDRQLILEAQKRGTLAKIGTYTRLSGPGWLQSAITLGGGSLVGSLFIGILAGVSLMWVQPLAMILGIVMLSAIGYVAITTGERPFQAVNRHINPVLGWCWVIATVMANLVWCLPQYSLGSAALQQNLFPELLSGMGGKIAATVFILVVVSVVLWFYNAGSTGIKIFETILKLMIGAVILCFVGVVVRLSFTEDGIAWGNVLAGFFPDFSMIFRPAESLLEPLQKTGDFRGFWSEHVVSSQRDVIIAAVATAVGINMTFLMPYAMLSRGWDKDFRGLAIFDISIGLFVPFLLATSCIIIASATQFHAEPARGLLPAVKKGVTTKAVEADAKIVGRYHDLLNKRLAYEHGKETLDSDKAKLTKLRQELPAADKRMAAMLVNRDAFNLAGSLERFTGPIFAQYIFGLGVVGMAISTIIVLALINGFALCEMLNLPSKGTPHRIGSYIVVAFGALGPFIWSGAQAYLAVPTSVFGMMLIPIAYIAFFLMMNQKGLLGDYLPRGGRRVVWNVLMGLAVILGTLGSFWAIYSRTGNFPGLGIQQRTFALILILILVVLGVIMHFRTKEEAR